MKIKKWNIEGVDFIAKTKKSLNLGGSTRFFSNITDWSPAGKPKI